MFAEKVYAIPYADGVKKIPVTETSHPMNGAAHQVIPVDLSRYGYVEEEFQLDGKAKLYSWLEGDRYAKPICDYAPYKTRFLVRRPVDPAKFSGTVMVEMMNWARHYDRTLTAWGNCWEHTVRKGDIWIGVTCKSVVLDNLKKFDAARYGELGFPNPRQESQWDEKPQANAYRGENTSPVTENGLAFDMYSQLAMLCREDDPRNPLYGYAVKKVIGTAGIPGDIATYVAAVDPISVTPEGKNIFDGFLIFMTGAPSNINQCEPKVHYQDDRCKFYGKVPLIRVYTTQDLLGYGIHADWGFTQRHPDSDEPGHYYRSYEVAGTGLILKYPYFTEPCTEDLERMGIHRKNARTDSEWTEEDLKKKEFPTRYVLSAAFENLERWIDGETPPRTQQLDTVNDYPDTRLVMDEYGNSKGGLRTPYVDVPAFNFQEDAVAVPLPEQTLASLYSDHNDYVKKVVTSAMECVQKRLLLPYDAAQIIRDAMDSDVLV